MRELGKPTPQKHGTARASRKADRPFILELTNALCVSPRNVQKDECGDWIIVARRGHVATDLLAFYAYVRARSPRHWKAVKRKLHFLCVTQDGDDEGIFILREMPTSGQAATIRKVLGIRRALALTDEQRASRRFNLAPKNRAVSIDLADVLKVPATNPVDEPLNEENRTNYRGSAGAKAKNA